MKSSVLQRIQEIYRTTIQGRKVHGMNQAEDDTPEVRRHNAFLAQKLQRKQDAKERLKNKDAVPTRTANRYLKGLVISSQFSCPFRRLYQSNRPMRFRDWIKVVSGLLDDLT